MLREKSKANYRQLGGELLGLFVVVAVDVAVAAVAAVAAVF